MRCLIVAASVAAAGCTTVSVEGPQARMCSRYVNLFLERTEHATPPANDSSKEWVNFGVAEAGQLELSNRDKAIARKVLTMCEEEGAEALERAKRTLRPWWRRIL